MLHGIGQKPTICNLGNGPGPRNSRPTKLHQEQLQSSSMVKYSTLRNNSYRFTPANSQPVALLSNSGKMH